MPSNLYNLYCKPLNLIIEIDGSSHDNKYEKDAYRQKDLEKSGMTVLRFTDLQVKKDMNNVIRSIEIWIDENKTNPLAPFSRGNPCQGEKQKN